MKMENVYPKNSKRKNNKKKCLYITPRGLKEKTVITHNMKSESLFFSFFLFFSSPCIHFLPFILGYLLHFPSFLFHLFSFIIIRKRIRRRREIAFSPDVGVGGGGSLLCLRPYRSSDGLSDDGGLLAITMVAVMFCARYATTHHSTSTRKSQCWWETLTLLKFIVIYI